MGSVGFPEILVILVVALVVLGPDKLPNAARQIGRAMAEFRRLTSGFEDEFRRAVDMASADDEETSARPSTTTPDDVKETPRHTADGDVPPPRD